MWDPYMPIWHLILIQVQFSVWFVFFTGFFDKFKFYVNIIKILIPDQSKELGDYVIYVAFLENMNFNQLI